MLSKIEESIIIGLLKKESFVRECIPFIKPEYFENEIGKTIFKIIENYFQQYNDLISKNSFIVELDKLTKISDTTHKNVSKIISELFDMDDSFDKAWLTNETEKWCQDRAIYLAVLESIQIIQDDGKNTNKHSIPELMRNALSVSFDKNIGHDYINDSESRFNYYHRVENKIAFDLEMFNKVTGGGISKKTLSCILAGTNVGKSMMLCHFAASYMSSGYNVLYITLEMAEEMIAQRIDANLMDISLDDVKMLPKNSFENKMSGITSKTPGKLMIKEYPTSSANANHFRFLLEEYKTKKNFVPDVIIVDYINICSSCRYKTFTNANSYERIKAIAEELRGLAVEKNVVVWTATQTNREGFASSDPDMTKTAESFGLPATLDFYVAMVRTDDLDKMNQVMVIQLKSRFGDVSKYKKFIVGVDRSKMKFYDVEPGSQTLSESTPQSSDDDSSYGAGYGKREIEKDKFERFKV